MRPVTRPIRPRAGTTTLSTRLPTTREGRLARARAGAGLGRTPAKREHDHRSRSAEAEEATEEGTASTRHSCKHKYPTTPGWEEAAESPMLPGGPPPLLLLSHRMAGERRPHERQRKGHPPPLPNGQAPLMGVDEGEVQGVRPPKKPRRREEELEEQREGQSLKGETYDTHYKNVPLKTLPTAPQTNPYKCHNSRLQYISYLNTSNTLDEEP